MSRTLITVIAIAAFFLLAFVTVIPLFENYKKYSLFKKIYTTIAVALLFLIGCFDVYIKASDPSETEKVLMAINRLEKIVGVKNKSNEKPPQTEKITTPQIEKTPMVKNRYKFALVRFGKLVLSKTIKEDSLELNYILLNTGNSDASKIKISTMMVIIVNGKIIPLPKKSADSYNDTFSLYPGKIDGQSAVSTLNLINVKVDSTYYCYKLDFNDSTKIRKSLNKIWHVETAHLFLDELDTELYKKIRNFLVRYKYWKSPFTQ